jgi:hypothetical protein
MSNESKQTKFIIKSKDNNIPTLKKNHKTNLSCLKSPCIVETPHLLSLEALPTLYAQIS